MQRRSGLARSFRGHLAWGSLGTVLAEAPGNMKFPVHIQKSRGGDAVVAFCPDLPGCSATAASADAALDVLKQRIVDYFARDAARPAFPGTRRTAIDL